MRRAPPLPEVPEGVDSVIRPRPAIPHLGDEPPVILRQGKAAFLLRLPDEGLRNRGVQTVPMAFCTEHLTVFIHPVGLLQYFDDIFPFKQGKPLPSCCSVL